MSEFDRLKEQKDAIVERERRRIISDAITKSQDSAAPRELSAERLAELEKLADPKLLFHGIHRELHDHITALNSRLEAAERDAVSTERAIKIANEFSAIVQRAITAEADNAKYKQLWSDIVESLQLADATNLTIIDEIDTLKADNAKLRLALQLISDGESCQCQLTTRERRIHDEAVCIADIALTAPAAPEPKGKP